MRVFGAVTIELIVETEGCEGWPLFKVTPVNCSFFFLILSGFYYMYQSKIVQE